MLLVRGLALSPQTSAALYVEVANASQKRTDGAFNAVQVDSVIAQGLHTSIGNGAIDHNLCGTIMELQCM